jgi:hypothetical protein
MQPDTRDLPPNMPPNIFSSLQSQIIKAPEVTVTDQKTSEILGEYQINPERNYQPNETRNSGCWPGSKR